MTSEQIRLLREYIDTKIVELSRSLGGRGCRPDRSSDEIWQELEEDLS